MRFTQANLMWIAMYLVISKVIEAQERKRRIYIGNDIIQYPSEETKQPTIRGDEMIKFQSSTVL